MIGQQLWRILATLWVCLLPGAAFAQSAPLNDQQLRSAFVLNFLRYTEWPASAFTAPDAAIGLCVLGNESAAQRFSGIDGKLAGVRPVTVRPVANAEEARKCHAVFIPEQDGRRFVSTLRALQHLAILTIGDSPDFIETGGMIRLIQGETRLQFEVNLGVVQQAQLRTSAQLLRLARSVIEVRP